MSTKYKCKNIDGCYFVSFATVGWVDVFTRRDYKNVLVENLKYCQREKGLEIFAWCIMSNHIHLTSLRRLCLRKPYVLYRVPLFATLLVILSSKAVPSQALCSL